MKPQTHASLLATLALLLSVAQLAAQSTAFTYQGRLDETGAPANGAYDLTFALFGANSGAGQVGVTLTNTPVGVTNGLFTVTLDFGANFPGASRWLEIGVRTNGGGAFSTLSPRQPLTSTPYAIRAASFSGIIASGQLSGTYDSAVTFNNPDNSFTGSGAGLTNVNATQLLSGTVPLARLTGITASQIANSTLTTNKIDATFHSLLTAVTTTDYAAMAGSATNALDAVYSQYAADIDNDLFWSWEFDTNEVNSLANIQRKGFDLVAGSAGDINNLTNGNLVVTNFGYGGCLYMRTPTDLVTYYVTRNLTNLGLAINIKGVRCVMVVSTNGANSVDTSLARQANLSAQHLPMTNNGILFSLTGTNLHFSKWPGQVQLDLKTNGLAGQLVDTNGTVVPVDWENNISTFNLQAGGDHGSKIVFGWEFVNPTTIRVYGTGQRDMFFSSSLLTGFGNFQNFWWESWLIGADIQHQMCLQSIQVFKTIVNSQPSSVSRQPGVGQFEGRSFNPQYARFQYSVANNNSGGNSGITWSNRALNTVIANNIGATLSSDQLTLTNGTYEIKAEFVTVNSNASISRMTNITAGAVTLRSPTYFGGSGHNNPLTGTFTVTGDTTYRFQVICSAAVVGYGAGMAANLGETETFADVQIWKLK